MELFAYCCYFQRRCKTHIYLLSCPQSVKGNELGGTFSLELDGYVTDDMAYDASATVVKEALEDLGNVGTVSVTR